MDNIKRKMAAGVGWMTLFKLAIRGLGLISTVILARLLVPADFGLVAMATSVVAAFELLMAFNFEVVLIQNQSAKRSHYDTAWTFNVLFGLSIAIIVASISGIAAEFFSEPRLQAVLLVLAVAFAIESFNSIGVVNLAKELKFKAEFRLKVIQHIARFSMTIPLAFWLQSYWALVFGILFGKTTMLAMTYIAAPHRPTLTLSASRELFRFSSWLLVNNLLQFLRNRSTEILLGRLASVQALGLFSVSFEISNLPTTELVAPINRAVLPGYAKMASKLSDLRTSYLEVISLITIFSLPAGAGIAATAHLIVPIALGEKWLSAIPVIQILAIYGGLNSMLTNSGAVFNALAKPYFMTIIQVATVALLLPTSYFLASESGALGLAWAYLYTLPAVILLSFWFSLKILELRAMVLLSVLWRSILSTFLMYMTVTNAFEHDTTTTPSVIEAAIDLAKAVTLGISAYMLSIITLWQISGKPEGAEKIVWSKSKEWLSHKLKLSESP
ncbi:MAG: lipopolysaccharide biosynthesis protein [Gammaproteobacteria bacterium]|nr:lipopolysaccharide biosynthesis protein [Gammaproteobacteria bacterium]